jgi:hypothetical protein
LLGGSSRLTLIDKLNLAVLTRDKGYAGTGSSLNVSVNIDGNDVVSHHVVFLPPFDIERANAGILPVADTAESPISFDTDSLTNSSIRVGITGDNMWKPEHILLLGRTDPASNEVVQQIPLAAEVDIRDDKEGYLSADTSEGRLTRPLRLVRLGSDSTIIRRVLLLIRTDNGDDDGTDDPIELQIRVGGGIALQQQINDTPQDDLEKKSHNWYFLNVAVPFTRSDVRSNGGIQLRDLGNDAWRPREVYVYGFDTAEGRPTEIVHLFSMTSWSFGPLSTDPSEGVSFVELPVS